MVSILIPAHNAEPWVAQTIRSALAQTWARREIIVVDDGSTDRTGAIARQFAGKDLLVAAQENQGASAARNKAFSLCQGEYIQWLDADDLLGPDKIARQMEAAERRANSRILYSCGWGCFYWRRRKAVFKPSPLWTDLAPAEWLRRKMVGGHHMQTATWLISRELSERAGRWDVRLLRDNDGEYLTRILLACDSVHFVPEAKVYYRLSGSGQITFRKHTDGIMESLWASMRLHVERLRSLEDSPETRAACLKYLQIWSVFFYPERMDIVAQAEQLAVELGGKLRPPDLSWKYAWYQKLFGWGAVQALQTNYNLQKLSLLQSWDGAMYRWEQSKKQTETL